MLYCYNRTGDNMEIKKILKTTITVIIFVIIGYLVYDNYYLITNKLEYFYVKYVQPDIKQNLKDNEYSKKENYEYVKINPNTTIKNKDEAKNAIYTFLDAGWDTYMVKCDPDYLDCTSDIKVMVENNTYLTDLSNFVHPFNTFEKVNTTFTSTGKVTLKRNGRYQAEQINQINQKVNEIYNQYYDNQKNVRENIKVFHDYIIKNTKYDTSNTSGVTSINSSTAYGVLFEGTGICSGYTDAMGLFLEKMGVKNYRISSDTHVWNLVYVDGAWYHLDLTWDDPITSDGSDTLSDKYFLITTEQLKNQSDKEHTFDKNIYLEAK